MIMKHRIALATIAAPLALALSACGGDGDLESADALEAVAAPDGQSWTEITAVTESDGYLLGNPDAPLKLIEYGSLTCSACANFAQTGASSLVDDYVSTGVVSYELRNQVHNAFDLTLAALVRCTTPDSFHPLADQVWNNFNEITAPLNQAQGALQARGQLDPDEMYVAIAEEAGFLDFFAARGISRDQARACLADSEAVLAIGERSDEQSEELNVTATPTFILNDVQLDERGWSDIEGVLQRAGARPAED